MKRIIFTILVLALTASPALANFPHSWPGYPINGPIPSPTAGYFTLTTHDMQTFDLFPGGGLTAQVDMNPSAPGIGYDMWPSVNNTEFQLKFNDPAGTWRSGQLGWSMFDPAPNYDDDTLPLEYYDLDDWDGWTISFHNEEFIPDQKTLNANLFMNIGWTDIGQSDLYVQNTWTTLYPCEMDNLVMDFSNVQAWGTLADGTNVSGQWVNISGDPRLGYISSLGVQIGSDVYPGDPALVKVCLDRVIPAPGAILLGSIGVGLVGWLRRRKSL